MGFHIEKERLLANLEALRKSLCCYGGRAPCDCKFGNDTHKLGSSEVCGCPELYQAIDMIRGEDAKAKETAAYNRGVTAERKRCEQVVDPTSGPISHKTCNAFTCLAAAQHMITAGLDPNAITAVTKPKRRARKVEEKAVP